jgi:hypothetical protein
LVHRQGRRFGRVGDAVVLLKEIMAMLAGNKRSLLLVAPIVRLVVVGFSGTCGLASAQSGNRVRGSFWYLQTNNPKHGDKPAWYAFGEVGKVNEGARPGATRPGPRYSRRRRFWAG